MAFNGLECGVSVMGEHRRGGGNRLRGVTAPGCEGVSELITNDTCNGTR